MDPRASWYPVRIEADFCVRTILDFCERKDYYWDKTPEQLFDELMAYVDEKGNIPCYLAIRIVRSARTCKLPGHANYGLKKFENMFVERAKEILCQQ